MTDHWGRNRARAAHAQNRTWPASISMCHQLRDGRMITESRAPDRESPAAKKRQLMPVGHHLGQSEDQRHMCLRMDAAAVSSYEKGAKATRRGQAKDRLGRVDGSTSARLSSRDRPPRFSVAGSQRQDSIAQKSTRRGSLIVPVAGTFVCW